MSITVANLQDNQVVFRIFITLLRFSFDSPMYFNSLKSSIKLKYETIFFNVCN